LAYPFENMINLGACVMQPLQLRTMLTNEGVEAAPSPELARPLL
jgi:hypothetical protein